MQKKNILKKRFIELTGSFFSTYNTCQKQQDYALHYALKQELDYLLLDGTEKFDLQDLIIIPVHNFNTDENIFKFHNQDKHIFYTTTPRKTKNLIQYPLFWTNSNPNFKKIRLFNKEISIAKYKRFLKYHRTNVLIYEDLYDKKNIEQQIIKCLIQGNSYLVNYIHGTPYNFYAVITDNETNSATFGDSIILENQELFLYFNLPEISDVHLYHNNKHLQKKHDKQGMFKISYTGSYHLIINRYTLNWIYTNPIYVT